MSMISKYLSFNRATFSSNGMKAGIKNNPGNKELKALQLMGQHIYDPVCEHFGIVFASSVYRNPAVNKLAGGSDTSGHVKGECIDLDGDAPSTSFVKVDNNTLFKWIKDNLKYDQLIAEYELDGSPKWVHVGFRAVGNRQQTLIATKNSSGKTVYMLYSDKLYQKVYRNSRDIDFAKISEEFIMPTTDFQTVIDELVTDSFLEEEFLGNRTVDMEEPLSGEGSVVTAEGPGIVAPEYNQTVHTVKVGNVVITISVSTDSIVDSVKIE